MQDKTPEQQELDKSLIRQAEELKITLSTKGWAEIAEPLLDKMIEDVIGAKKNGRWDSGSFGGYAYIQFGAVKMPSMNLSPENLMWYRQALIDFHNRIMSIIDAGEAAKERIKTAATIKDQSQDSGMLSGPYAPNAEAQPGKDWSRYNSPNPDTDGGVHG